MLGHNQETFRYIQDNFPNSLTVARSVSDYRLQEDLNVELREEKSESKGVKLKRRVSSMMRTKSILKKKEALDEDACFDDLAVSKAPGCSTLDENGSDNENIFNWNYDATSLLITFVAGGPSEPSRSQRLHNLRVRRQSLTYRGACLSTARSTRQSLQIKSKIFNFSQNVSSGMPTGTECELRPAQTSTGTAWATWPMRSRAASPTAFAP